MNKIKTILPALNSVIPKKKESAKIHALFNQNYPVAIAVSDKLHIFREQNGQFTYDTSITIPMKVSVGTRAAFCLNENSDSCCCVVTPDCLEEPNFYTVILHEFVHCYQSRTCERKLRNTLLVYRNAMEIGDNMWEINHPFPYLNPSFVSLIKKSSGYNQQEFMAVLSDLKQNIDILDYEFMIWQMWKEGFARFIENKIRKNNNLKFNTNGSDHTIPERASLYFTGERFWQLQPDGSDIESAFHLLTNPG